MTGTPLLETRSLTKEFRGFRAVSDVDLTVGRGTVHALVGPNGAGKTTLFNLLTGFLTPSSGTVDFDGQDITGMAPEQIATSGSPARSRSPSLFEADDRCGSTSSWRWPARPGVAMQCWRSVDAHGPLRGPLHGAARAGRPRRPAGAPASLAGLRPEAGPRARHRDGPRPEAAAARRADRRHGARGRRPHHRPRQALSEGRTVVLVDHNMHVVGSLADRVTVLQSGQVLAEGPYDQVRADERVITAYLGAVHE